MFMDPSASAEIGKLRLEVSKLERKIGFLFEQLNVQYKEPEESYVTDVKNFINSGKEVDAAKHLRELKGVGLMEAKLMVDEIKSKM